MLPSMLPAACLSAALLLPCAHASAQAVTDAVDGRTFFLPLLTREAQAHGLPPEIADAVAMVETGYRPDAVGSSGEIGLMQVMPATAAQLGFRGTSAALADPATNIRLGVTYLARAWTEGGGDICRTLTKYRAGLGENVMSPLSAQYCARAVAWLMGGRGLARAAVADAAMPDLAKPDRAMLDLVMPDLAMPDPPIPDRPIPDPHVIAMPPMRPLPPMPDGVRLTPIFAMAHRAVAPGPRRSGGHALSLRPKTQQNLRTTPATDD